MLTFCVCVLPSTTFPNESDVGLEVRVPALTAVPETAIFSCPAPLDSVTVPEGFPADCGAKAISKVAL